MRNVRSLMLKMQSGSLSGGCGIFASSSTLERDVNVNYSQVGPVGIEHIGPKSIVKFAHANFTYHVCGTDIPQWRGLVQLSFCGHGQK